MLLPVDMREWLPPDHLVWFVLETVDALDTSALELTRRRGGVGAAGYDPGMLFGLLVYAYCQGVRSSRQIDLHADMLAIARDRLLRAGSHNAQVRLADTYRLPFANGVPGQGFDVVLFHQVLHYLDDPGAAVAEAARVMAPGGRLLIADFAPHKEEFLRDEFAHRRLGFSDREVEGWFAAAGLSNAGSETIAPQGEGEKLTVKLWLATAKARTKKEAA